MLIKVLTALPLGVILWLFSVQLSAAPATAEAPQSRVSLDFRRKPLTDLLQQLSVVSGVSLEAEPEMENQKLLLLVKDRPVADVLDRVAELLGAEWVERPKEGVTTVRRLQRLPITKQWVARWRLLRNRADAHARRLQTELVRKLWDDWLRGLDDPGEGAAKPGGTINLDGARFLKSLGSAPLDRLAGQFGEMSPTRAGGQVRRSPPAVVFSFNDLSAGQQSMLRDYFANRVSDPGDYNAQFLAHLSRARIALISTDGVAVDLQVLAPFRPEPATIPVFGSSYSPEKMSSLSDEEFGRTMASQKTPEEVLLGAQLKSDLSADPAMQITDPAVAHAPVKLDAPPLRWEFFSTPAEAAPGLNIIADHYTSSVRLSKPALELKNLLREAASDYKTVFRQEGAYLLARKITWPDADLAEAPAPFVEGWIDRRQLDGSDLSFEEIARLASFSDEQLDLLATYKDPVARVGFREELDAARKVPERRRLLQVLAQLSAAQQKQLRSESGLPLGTATRSVREGVAAALPPHLRREIGRSRLSVAPGRLIAKRPSMAVRLIKRMPNGKYIPLAILASVWPAR